MVIPSKDDDGKKDQGVDCEERDDPRFLITSERDVRGVVGKCVCMTRQGRAEQEFSTQVTLTAQSTASVNALNPSKADVPFVASNNFCRISPITSACAAAICSCHDAIETVCISALETMVTSRFLKWCGPQRTVC